MIVLAHVAGVPVEELLAYAGPPAVSVAGAALLHFRALFGRRILRRTLAEDTWDESDDD